MHNRERKYSADELARRGDELYHSKIRVLVEPANDGRIVAIDVDTGDFHVADQTLEACLPLIARNPGAQIWSFCIGRRAVGRIGSRLKPEGL